jgi:hypothetical protein
VVFAIFLFGLVRFMMYFWINSDTIKLNRENIYNFVDFSQIIQFFYFTSKAGTSNYITSRFFLPNYITISLVDIKNNCI